MPTVSIIVPVYNVAPYIEKAVQSILSQTFTDFEVIIINDGCTDQTTTVLKNMKKDSRIRVIHKDNEGVSAARNDGIRAAHGTYLYFMDSDDELDPKLLTTALTFAEKADLVMFGYYKDKLDDTEKRVAQTSVSMKQGLHTRENPPEWSHTPDTLAMMGYIWNKLYKRDIILKHHLFFNEDMDFLEDIDFNTNVFHIIQTLAIVNDCLYHYKRRPQPTLVSTFRPNAFLDQLKAITHRETIMKDWQQTPLEIEAATALLHVHAIKGSCVNLFLNKNNLSFIKKYRCLKEIMHQPLTQKRMQSFEPQTKIEKVFQRTISHQQAFLLALISKLYATSLRKR